MQGLPPTDAQLNIVQKLIKPFIVEFGAVPKFREWAKENLTRKDASFIIDRIAGWRWDQYGQDEKVRGPYDEAYAYVTQKGFRRADVV